MGDVRADRAERVVAAVAAEELAEARAIVATLNQDVAAWNAKVDEEYHFELVDEIWLLSERENARR